MILTDTNLADQVKGWEERQRYSEETEKEMKSERGRDKATRRGEEQKHRNPALIKIVLILQGKWGYVIVRWRRGVFGGDGPQ